MKFELDIKPISINKFFQGRRFITPEGKEYQRLYHFLLPKKKMIKGYVKMDITFEMANRFSVRDLDNPIKPLIDAIVKKGIIEDDRFITELNIKKVKADKERVKIKIYE